MKKDKTMLFLVLFFFIGLSILFYPSLSNYTNKKIQSKRISNYESNLKKYSQEDYDKYFDEAIEYNNKLSTIKNRFINYKKIEGYENIFNVNSDGIIGYINIEKLNIELPIMYGTSSKTLNTSVGLLEGSSFPTGTMNTHAVLSAHRGLPSSKLFTDLDKIEIGDTFYIKIYDRIFWYEVDNISIVKPNETENLEIVEDKEYVTLMTCTPYGINTHRLLVRAHRTDEFYAQTYITTKAFKINKIIVASVICIPMLLSWLILIILKPVDNNKNLHLKYVYPTEYKLKNKSKLKKGIKK